MEISLPVSRIRSSVFIDHSRQDAQCPFIASEAFARRWIRNATNELDVSFGERLWRIFLLFMQPGLCDINIESSIRIVVGLAVQQIITHVKRIEATELPRPYYRG